MTYDFILCIVFRKIVFKAIKQKKNGKKAYKCIGDGDVIVIKFITKIKF